MLIILDPSLRSYNGHFFTYDRVIADEAARRGSRTIVFASKRISADRFSDLIVVPCFRFDLEDPENDRSVAIAFMADLRAAISQIVLETDTTFFMHTTTYRQISPALQVIAQKQHINHQLVIFLRYSLAPNPTYPNAGEVDSYRRAFEAIEHLAVAGRVRLVTDSELLRAEYGGITDHPIELLPIPHVGGPPVPTTKPYTLTYLGNARATKGFQYLPYMVAQIRTRLQWGAWLAEFQANVMFRRDTESAVALCQLRNEPVKLWEDELSPEAYEAVLNRSNIVLIPYQTLYYHAQTSGVLAEAIGRGKPVVVPRGTWMARQVAGSGAAVSFAPGDRVDFARAVIVAMDNVRELTRCAVALREVWIREHNPQRFMDRLLKQSLPT